MKNPNANALSYHSLLLLPFSIPLLNPRSPFLAAFPHRHGAPAPAPPRTAAMSSPTTVSVPVPVVPVLAPSPIPAIITVPIVPLSLIVLIVVPAPMPWAQTPAPAPAYSVAPVPPEEPPPELPPNQLDVHEITISPSVAAVLLELAARGFAKVGHRREVGDYGATIVEAALQRLKSGSGLILLLELDIYVADHVIGEVVADVEALDLAELGELLEDVLVEVLEMLLDLARVEGLALGVDAGGDHVGPLVHVGQQQRGTDGWAVVQARAAVTVAASADLEIEGAVDAVLLCAEDGRQVLRHSKCDRGSR